MKDSDARYWIRGLRERVERQERVIEKLADRLISGISIKHCNKCKHDTVHQDCGHPDPNHVSHRVFWSSYKKCLNCGTIWDCYNVTTCKEVKAKK